MDARDLEEYAAYYLPRLADDEDAYHALIEADAAILPILVRAFRRERDGKLRAKILEVMWQHRDPSIIPVLAEALQDPSPRVWKEAFDGLVTLDRPECIGVIEGARNRTFEREQDATYFRSFLDEAIDQLRHGFFGEKDKRKNEEL